MPELLSGEEKESVLEALIPVEGSRLRLLAGDRPTQDARQQLTSRRLGALVDQLRREAEYVVLDTPPCGLLADSAGLTRLADGTLYVLRSGAVEMSHIVDSLQFLSETGTPLMGCVLNGVQTGQGGYGYGYGYGYGGYRSYGYGTYARRKTKAEES